MEELENFLYNAIIGWFDNSLTEYKGLDDPEFIEKVCDDTQISEADYRALMLDGSEDLSWRK